MKVAITGGTGFIGNYVVEELLSRNIEVVVTGTSINKARKFLWFENVRFLELDINNITSEDTIMEIASADKLIHLAWSGLPNYKDLFHFEENLMPQYSFIKRLVALGLSDITITGTCFEYGMREGALDTNIVADPHNCYALAKDTLRKFLIELQKKEDFKLKWLRLFYMYGRGQSAKSILAQLEQALENGDEVFNMSAGAQTRDYMHVKDVAIDISNIAFKENLDGVFNICSGNPITIKRLVEDYLVENNKAIKLNLGFYPYPDYEPMAFWGIRKNID